MAEIRVFGAPISPFVDKTCRAIRLKGLGLELVEPREELADVVAVSVTERKTTARKQERPASESGDVLASAADLPEPIAGDLLALPASGAYGISMASNYNGQLRPPVVFVDGGRARLVARREHYSELVAREL